MKIPLGVTACDMITRYQGVVVSRVEYITGCTQYGIAAPVQPDGKVPDAIYVDEARLRIVDDGVSGYLGPAVRDRADSPPGGDMGRDAPKR
jgi:hypothetical protein